MWSSFSMPEAVWKLSLREKEKNPAHESPGGLSRRSCPSESSSRKLQWSPPGLRNGRRTVSIWSSAVNSLLFHDCNEFSIALNISDRNWNNRLNLSINLRHALNIVMYSNFEEHIRWYSTINPSRLQYLWLLSLKSILWLIYVSSRSITLRTIPIALKCEYIVSEAKAMNWGGDMFLLMNLRIHCSSNSVLVVTFERWTRNLRSYDVKLRNFEARVRKWPKYLHYDYFFIEFLNIITH
jgi:hypothetical protein